MHGEEKGKNVKKFKAVEIENEEIFLTANGNFSEEEEKEIKKTSDLENVLELLQSCRILNIIFHNRNSEAEGQIFIEMFNKFLNLKNFKEIEKIEIFNGNSSLTIRPKEKSFKIYYRGGSNTFSFDSGEENLNQEKKRLISSIKSKNGMALKLKAKFSTIKE